METSGPEGRLFPFGAGRQVRQESVSVLHFSSGLIQAVKLPCGAGSFHFLVCRALPQKDLRTDFQPSWKHYRQTLCLRSLAVSLNPPFRARMTDFPQNCHPGYVRAVASVLPVLDGCLRRIYHRAKPSWLNPDMALIWRIKAPMSFFTLNSLSSPILHLTMTVTI